MTSYLATIRAEWLAAGWVHNPYTRSMVLPASPECQSDEEMPYIPATLLMDAGVLGGMKGAR